MPNTKLIFRFSTSYLSLLNLVSSERAQWQLSWHSNTDDVVTNRVPFSLALALASPFSLALALAAEVTPQHGHGFGDGDGDGDDGNVDGDVQPQSASHPAKYDHAFLSENFLAPGVGKDIVSFRSKYRTSLTLFISAEVSKNGRHCVKEHSALVPVYPVGTAVDLFRFFEKSPVIKME